MLVEGGSLGIGATTYVERPIDQQLYDVLTLTGTHYQVCAILAPRQMGKTSLVVRTANRLAKDEVAIPVRIDLHGLGQVNSEEALWFNLLQLICRQLKDDVLVQQLDATWNQNRLTLPSVRFTDFLRHSVLPGLSCKLVIFLDEIQDLVAWDLHGCMMNVLRSLVDTGESWVEKLAFVLVGVAKPSDLLQHNHRTAWNVGTSLELTGLTGPCEPLMNRFRDAVSCPESVMQSILEWTGGQPFLTQWVCQLIKDAKDMTHDNPEQLVESVIIQHIITSWQRQDQQNHLQEIDHWFNLPLGERSENVGQIKLAALNLYRKLLNQESVEFMGTDQQWELLTSGLTIKRDNGLSITNQIYQRVFDLSWVKKKEQYLNREGIEMPDLNTVVERDVYILIDQSGSMLKTDGGQTTRWDRLGEQCMGDINKILKYSENRKKICDEVIMMPYNVNRYRGNRYTISKPAHAASFFEESDPMGNANIAPTLRECFQEWLGEREKITAAEIEAGQSKGAIFAIYIDGQFDDSPAFETLVQEMCSKIDDDRIIKIIILGFGQDVNSRYFDEIDDNKRKGGVIFKNAQGNPCDIIVFELVDGLDPSEGVVEVMIRQLGDTGKNREGFGQYD